MAIIDEAGLMSSRQMLSLLQKAEKTHSRLILIGDTKQLSSIEAGGPFGLLQRSGLSTTLMSESRRQQDPDLKIITDLAAQGQIAQSYKQLEQINRITQIRDPEARITAAAQDYLSLSPQERTQTLLLAGTNAEREAITQTIRAGLKTEGSLSAETMTLEVLKPKYLDAWAKKQAVYYEPGDTIIFGTNYKHFTQGQPYRVTDIDLQSNRLTLTDPQGKIHNSPCNQHVNRQVYQLRPLELAIGDQGRFTKNSPKRKQINGQPFRVTALNSSTNEITLHTKGWETTYKAQDLPFIDHNYVSTTYAAQGKTQDNVIWCVDTAHPQTLGKEAYYVAVSRERHDLQIYTDDPTTLKQAILPSRAKANPSELLASSSSVQTAPAIPKDLPVPAIESQSQPIDPHQSQLAQKIYSTVLKSLKRATAENMKLKTGPDTWQIESSQYQIRYTHSNQEKSFSLHAKDNRGQLIQMKLAPSDSQAMQIQVAQRLIPQDLITLQDYDTWPWVFDQAQAIARDQQALQQGLVKGYPPEQITKTIEQRSPLIAHWQKHQSPAMATAKTIQYLEKLLEQAQSVLEPDLEAQSQPELDYEA